uniref:Nucleoside diphosphate-linked moiety X motif 6 n=1 Tax=Petromyzon marinus TaxID=7757 RepID=A0AAJ7U923_PETMA|nr:nucleoside diphosphate-linked moiety X motif 6 [Petromyzon marinus]
MGEARNEEAESASRRRRGSGETTVLAGRSDPYGGLTILISSTDTTDVETFRNQLKDSLFVWTLEGVRGLWLCLPIERADLVPVAVKCGFVYHHALPSYCMLTAWLPRDSTSTIPAYASHYVGVGGLVVSEEGLVLLIQEKFAKGHGCWKLPGGHVEPGEDLGEAVCREVREETGVSVRFRSVLALRHMHRYSFGSSDLYFVCLARPLTRRLQPCPTEIHACTWVPVGELPSFISSSSSSAFHCWLVRVCLDALSSGLVIRPLDREASPTSSSALVYTATGGDPRRTGVPADPAGERPDDTDAAGSPRNANTGSLGDNNRGSPIDPLQGSQDTPIERPLETPTLRPLETPTQRPLETPTQRPLENP